MPKEADRPAVLITGSSGFLGQAIARGLRERYRVIGLDIQESRQPLDGMETVEIDLTSDESVDAAVRKAAGPAEGPIARALPRRRARRLDPQPRPSCSKAALRLR